MDPFFLGLSALGLVLMQLVIRVPIAFALGSSAMLGLLTFFAWRPGGEFEIERAIGPTISLLGSTPFDFVHNYPLSMIPLFIALGHIAYHSEITTDIYYTIRVWLSRLPGGLAMASVLGCGGFSAITGSSVACASAMGRIAVPEMLRYNYSPRLATASVAAGGTLGSLIPPSILFVIYAIFTEQSVKILFVAGILPGVLSLIGFLVTIYVWARINPVDAPTPDLDISRGDRLKALLKIWPAALLLGTVIGGISFGVFTPTEAAAVSVVLATLIGWLTGRLSKQNFILSLKETAFQTSMIFAIALGAKIFVAFLSLTQLAPTLLSGLQGSGASMWAVLLGIVVLYLILGMFLDSIGILVLTLPLTVPLIEGYGLDLVWFGVVVVKLLEIGLITPPIGLNVFIIKGVSPAKVIIEDIFHGIMRFLLLDIVVLALIILVPAISLFLPSLLK
jgi:C4-dicarboxylate transporter DctM subunit